MNTFKRHFKKSFLLLAVIGAISCETIIDVDLPEHKPALVLNSFFGPDTTFNVTIHESKGILDATYGFSSISAVDIELFNSEKSLGKFRPLDGTPGAYELDVYPEAGVNYSVVATKNGYDRVEAADIIPLKKTNPSIEKFEEKIDEGGYRYFEMTYSFDDPPGADYYEVLLFAFIPRYEYYQDEDTAFQYQNGYWKEQINYFEPGVELNEFEETGNISIFSDGLFNGKDHRNTIGIDNYSFYYEDYSVSKKVKFSLEVRHISSAYYQYQISRQLQQQSEGNPFAEAALIYNNIKGGFGIFAGYDVEAVEFEYSVE